MVVLPAVPVMPMLGPLQRSSNRSPRHERRAPRARSFTDPRRDLGRPDVEVRDLGLTGVGIEVDAGLDIDPELTQLPRLGRLGLRARESHRVALAGEQSRERHCVGVEPLDQDIHTWIIAGRRRSPARTRASRRVARGAGRAAGDCRTARRRGDDAVREQAAPIDRKLLHSQSSARSTKPCLAAFLQRVATGAVELFLGDDGSGVVRALEEVPLV